MDVYQSKQLIKKPTRVTAKTRTLIDVIITQLGNTSVTASGVTHLGISDHSLVYTCRKISTLVLKLGNLNILTVGHLKTI